MAYLPGLIAFSGLIAAQFLSIIYASQFGSDLPRPALAESRT
jgi:hypothetical protein